MTGDEIRAFITAAPPHTGKLATVRADGRPHVAPVWYAVDDDGSIVLTTGKDPVKLSDDLDQLRQWATVLGGRYIGEDTAKAFGERNAVPGELLARLLPQKV